MDKSYNKFERAYEIMTELVKESPLPIDPIELNDIETKELKYLKNHLNLWLIICTQQDLNLRA